MFALQMRHSAVSQSGTVQAGAARAGVVAEVAEGGGEVEAGVEAGEEAETKCAPTDYRAESMVGGSLRMN